MKLSFRIFAVLTLICAVTIFLFSANPAEQSDEQSLAIGRFICNLFVPGFEDTPADRQEELVSSINFAVRKTAHATEYCILGFLACGAAQSRFYSAARRAALGAWVFAVLYACSDEVHQYFVPGRACKFMDVCIDSGGALVGVLIAFAIFQIILRHKKEAVA